MNYALRFVQTTFILVLAAALASCGKRGAQSGNNPKQTTPSADNIVNVYFWAEYLAPDTISEFEKRTGIKVNVSYMDSYETLETKLLTGHSDFDVVLPTSSFFGREIRAGAYRSLDRKQLPNWSHLDPHRLDQIAAIDPGNAHGTVLTFGRFGIAYDPKKLARLLPSTTIDGLSLVFDPRLAAKVSSCGITFIDDPRGIVRLALRYLGRNMNSPTQQDLQEVETLLLKIRPYLRNIDTAGYTDAMANGDICVAIAYNSDVALARRRARETNNGVTWEFVTPKEGTMLYLDMVSIPSDAPHVANAHRFINYLMEPQVAARLSNSTGIASANRDSRTLLDSQTASDSTIYPDAETLKRVHLPAEPSAEMNRATTRLWQKFKTGQ